MDNKDIPVTEPDEIQDLEGFEDPPSSTCNPQPAEEKQNIWYHRRMVLAMACVFYVIGVVGIVLFVLYLTNAIAIGGTAPLTQSEQIACNFIGVPDAAKCRLTDFAMLQQDPPHVASTIPSEIGLLTQLTYFAVGGDGMTSTIPTEIGLLTQLSYLSFSLSKLYGTIPNEISLLTKLGYLSFYYSEFSGTIPTELSLLTQLENLQFEGNELTGTIPSEIGVLTELQSLKFEHNNFNGTIPSSIGLLTQLTSLNFEENNFTGTISSEIGLLQEMEKLSFWKNAELRGTIPSSLCSPTFLFRSIEIDSCIECEVSCCISGDGSEFSPCGESN